MPPRELRFRPGSCALRLSNIERLSPDQKTELVRSVANDITAVFIYIARQAEAGNLTTANTEPINDVISVIRDTEVKHRQKLEDKLARYERAAQRRRRERRWLRVELGRVIRRTKVAAASWKTKTDELTARLAEAQKRLAFVQEKYELLLSSKRQDHHHQQDESESDKKDAGNENSVHPSCEGEEEKEKKKNEADVTIEAQ
ncbi:hypothetical protein VTN96DRAFT_1964 [Rasamsonia emersonii]|uniref:Uncharacterized protein n=1 Tax=Rasamsonia emersonii (strain ATCC 16479 / CBS 393.64 / IMI 116815) TaxID=1408163 RepID=A0A0F4YP47_RASE3|nr:hypothetical protein T310_5949 [Rasamsonia emersonii CBS 393.64]KKA20042.1 hypothetical protein T310_5949 [Rasamsonia emersonii CBS 393.64]